MIDTIYTYLTNDLGFTKGTADAIVGGITAGILIVAILGFFKSARRFCCSIIKVSLSFIWKKIKPCNWCKNNSCNKAKKATDKSASESLSLDKLNNLFIHDGITFLRGKTNRPICPACYDKNNLVYLIQTETDKTIVDACNIPENKVFQLGVALGTFDGNILALSCTECDYKKELTTFGSLEKVIEKAKNL